MDRHEMGALIAQRLAAEAERMAGEFQTRARIGSTMIDNLLPEQLTRDIYNRFPGTDRMMLRRSIKEHKRVAAQMDSYDPLLEEAVYAFQQPEVVRLITEITGLEALEPDCGLYAGGISLMTKDGYLRPHLDNSHDAKRQRYRVLNLLFYVTPGWREEFGGSLQLWDHGPLTRPRSFPSLFNRLVLMVTNKGSWHSVNDIVHDGRRCCVSNYYFSPVSPEAHDYFHATSFRGEHAGLEDLAMQADNALRTTVLKTLPGVYKNPHAYHRPAPAMSDA
ncbi:MAG TPA: 2OG-Fe(II) oxygenase [Caulobacteraceae bacterium]|jgi:Rps23 Pro-64 3,4-dihydroxylase Tpa1-like proline 4-hydroxylase|nr:2OG-Fe(II) oxygenase [Caulobacteraceae bacterium]